MTEFVASLGYLCTVMTLAGPFQSLEICIIKSYLNWKDRLLTPLQLGTLCNSKIDSFGGLLV